CYVNGEFVSPNMSLVEMTKTVDDALRREMVWFPMRYMAKRQLPRLEHWR
ncbi:MAG: zinc ribbon domain-containing protein, partial [Actinomycetota bacterium]